MTIEWGPFFASMAIAGLPVSLLYLIRRDAKQQAKKPEAGASEASEKLAGTSEHHEPGSRGVSSQTSTPSVRLPIPGGEGFYQVDPNATPDWRHRVVNLSQFEGFDELFGDELLPEPGASSEKPTPANSPFGAELARLQISRVGGPNLIIPDPDPTPNLGPGVVNLSNYPHPSPPPDTPVSLRFGAGPSKMIPSSSRSIRGRGLFSSSGQDIRGLRVHGNVLRPKSGGRYIVLLEIPEVRVHLASGPLKPGIYGFGDMWFGENLWDLASYDKVFTDLDLDDWELVGSISQLPHEEIRNALDSCMPKPELTPEEEYKLQVPKEPHEAQEGLEDVVGRIYAPGISAKALLERMEAHADELLIALKRNRRLGD